MAKAEAVAKAEAAKAEAAKAEAAKADKKPEVEGGGKDAKGGAEADSEEKDAPKSEESAAENAAADDGASAPEDDATTAEVEKTETEEEQKVEDEEEEEWGEEIEPEKADASSAEKDKEQPSLKRAQPTAAGVFPPECLVEIACGEEGEKEVWMPAQVLEMVFIEEKKEKLKGAPVDTLVLEDGEQKSDISL